MSVRVEIVNAFVDGAVGGNPAGVVLDADGLSHAERLAVAQRVGLSETAFVSASERATFKLDFYTPTRQIAHCGHATIATFCRLRELGRIGDGTLSKETIDGRRDIVVHGDMAFMEQRSPTYARIDAGSAHERRLLESLRLARSALADGLAPAVVNTGNAFLVVPVRDAQALAALRPDMDLVARLSDELDLVGYYAYTAQTQRAMRDAGTRMFAPRYGIEEESATGMAAGPLACYLRDQAGLGAEQFCIEQGWFMQPASPSVIQVNLETAGGTIQRLLAGGKARSVRTIEV
ncbi:PhzF family phenazine biosynthesis protein [Roseateles saccharophilus]|uniref:PhzF family phenazine biosynthesis protein n=1 Tax=Roseateles saccharophilus TaxID=304 RepID=A0A4R3UBN7_ROSSA|nr:PhzF family phenazine biosynthesis protein [Roseateles saccharophilus]MDG0835618.1 PhzF family phenazine biosynthesis protein [Roseateles saccharophilus]TCU85125.1 PhzF family phenazine biosynthesis protein [Roseateles saccharophilus]